MSIRKLIAVLSLLLIPLPALAQGDTPVYTIKKGDTLWGISQRFLKDPHYWPNLWANNTFVTNPHLIYPGQRVAIRDGRLVILPAETPAEPVAPIEETAVAAAPVAPVEPEAVEAITVQGIGGREGFITASELEGAGTLVDADVNRILLAEDDRVFIRMDDLASAQVGDLHTLFEVGRMIKHPVTKEPLGYQVADLGTVRITELTPSVAVGVIEKSYREIQRSARLRPYVEPDAEIALKKASSTLGGIILAGRDEKLALGQFDIIYVDLGDAEGLEKGNLLYIARPRSASEFAPQGIDVDLPDVLLGSAVVLSTRENTAAALVLKAVSPLYVGDKAFTLPPEACAP